MNYEQRSSTAVFDLLTPGFRTQEAQTFEIYPLFPVRVVSGPLSHPSSPTHLLDLTPCLCDPGY